MRRALLVLLLLTTASAHVPTFNEAGSSAESAFTVDDPGKSWVFYDDLHGGQHWFVFQMTEGEELFTGLSLPPDEAGRPSLWIAGPGFTDAGPNGTPAGMGALRVPAEDDLGVEPFSPLAMRSTAQWRDAAPGSGTFYIVVEGTGTYALAIGARESFTPLEWITIPIERIAIQDWGGVPWPLAITGEVVGLAVAMAYLRRRAIDGMHSLGILAAGLIAGTALTTGILATVAAVKGGPSMALLIPAVFALLAIGVAAGALRAVQRDRWVAALLWSVAGLTVWAGLLVGPVALIGWAAWRGAQSRRDAP